MKPQQAQELGQYIAGIRKEHGISRRGLARAVQADWNQLVRLENGDVASPRAELLGRIADELAIPVNDLMTMAGYPTSTELPGLRPYMRAKYRELPTEAVAEVEAFVAHLQRRHRNAGPAPGEDET